LNQLIINHFIDPVLIFLHENSSQYINTSKFGKESHPSELFLNPKWNKHGTYPHKKELAEPPVFTGDQVVLPKQLHC